MSTSASTRGGIPAPLAHIILSVVAILPLVVPVPTNINIVVTAAATVLCGSFRSVKDKPPQDTMTQKVRATAETKRQQQEMLLLICIYVMRGLVVASSYYCCGLHYLRKQILLGLYYQCQSRGDDDDDGDGNRLEYTSSSHFASSFSGNYAN